MQINKKSYPAGMTRESLNAGCIGAIIQIVNLLQFFQNLNDLIFLL